MRSIALIAVLYAVSAVSAAPAQEHMPQWKKECREKAVAAGLLTKGKGRANHASNQILKEERQTFMRKCKKETLGAAPSVGTRSAS